MYRVGCLNKINGKQFERKFDSYFLMKQFVNKCKYSKKVAITYTIGGTQR